MRTRSAITAFFPADSCDIYYSLPSCINAEEETPGKTKSAFRIAVVVIFAALLHDFSAAFYIAGRFRPNVYFTHDPERMILTVFVQQYVYRT